MEKVITNNLSRRSFIRTATGALLSIPFLESSATGQISNLGAPKRLVFLGSGYGFTENHFFPKKKGNITSGNVPEGMKPLENHLGKLSVVSNINSTGDLDPHMGSTGYLSAGRDSVSCDQIAAEAIGKNSRFPSLILTVRESASQHRSGHGRGSKSLSWNKEGKSIPGIASPIELYKTLFADAITNRPDFEEALKEKKSVIDLLKINAKSLSKGVDSVDRDKLGEYFQSIRDIEKKIDKQVEWAKKTKPEPPFAKPVEFAVGKEQAMMNLEMLAVALKTDNTRVATYMMPNYTLTQSLGIGASAHSISHYRTYKKFAEDSKKRDIGCAKILAHFLDKLDGIKDVDGRTLLDNCIVSYGSNIRSGHGMRNIPAIIAGGGAKNIPQGKHIILKNKQTPIAQYWLTLLREAGVPVDSFKDQSASIPEFTV